MVSQVAAPLMLLLTGFLVLGLSKSSSIQTKFDPRPMVLLPLDPVRDGYTVEKVRALFEKLPERLKAGGLVHSVALAAQAPFSSKDATSELTAEDPRDSSRAVVSVAEETVGAGYFAALGEPMLAGREFDELD